MNNRMFISSREDVESAVKRLDANDPTLQRIILFPTNIYELGTIAAHIGHHLSHLKKIAIGGHHPDVDVNEQMKVKEAISLIIRKQIPCLQQINIFSMCSVEIRGSIAESLLQNQYIKSLEFYNCRVGDKGAKIMAGILQNRQCALEHLYISSNAIGDCGCTAIVNVLSSNSSLKVLCLSNNNIGAEGCRSIAGALKNKEFTLQELNLSFNRRIGDNECISMANSLRHNTSLKKFHLKHCSISCRGWTVMEKNLREKNYTLFQLVVDHNSTFRIKFDGLLRLNRERPVEAEIRKTSIFPHRLLKNLQQQEEGGGPSFSCKVEMLVKIMSFENLSALFNFIQENPLIFGP